MEPRIQYAKTSDGVNIAYWTMGEGPPLVVLPSHPYSHLQREWHVDEMRHSLERLARNRQVVRYDSRGSGLSTRDVQPYTLDALTHDLESVADRVGLEKFAVFSTNWRSSPVAVSFAAKHPERVSRMVLWCSAARAEEITGSSQVQGLAALMDKSWEVFLETAVRTNVGWSEPGAPEVVEFMRESVAPAQGRAAQRLLFSFDVTDLLPLVQAPTLVLHRREVAYPDVGAAGALASALPNARLVLLEGASLAYYLGDVDQPSPLSKNSLAKVNR